ncbi:tetratricopeptide repeat protein [Lederbergia citrea]|uniref:tetratricopeptide repeat protein n=1 Tax=Lederbergia citrea TaxID=2833581 RepID=UPI001BCA1940|nr:tetratricopeptide repeat protein [Lederbergia citrea]MBS4202724.1 tetratricopeptide repeat protein [Lederbergia citrea]
MKREQTDRDSEKIIPFPDLKQRLYEKGIARLEAHDFHEAVALLYQAREMDLDDAQIAVAFLVALYENGDYEEAKLIANEYLHEGIGDYYEILDIYLMILIQINEHKQVIQTLDVLFEEREVPPDKAEHFQTLLQLSRKVIANGTPERKENVLVEEGIFNGRNLHEQAIKLGSLVDKNIQPYLDSLVGMLADKRSHPFLQTIVLNVLREHGIEIEIVVKKLEFDGVFIPINLPLVHNTPQLKEVLTELESQLENNNPVLLEQIKEMSYRHAFILYPFESSPSHPRLWAAAYRGMGYEMYGEEWSKEKVAEKYGVDVMELDRAVSFLLNLEEISSPIE